MDMDASNARYLEMVRVGRGTQPSDSTLSEVRVALLADSAIQQMVLVLTTAIREVGLSPKLWPADYGTLAQQAYDPGSELYLFRPELVYVILAVQKYRDRFYETATGLEREALPASYLQTTLGIVDAIASRGISVIVTNFAPVRERMFGNFGAITRQSVYGSVREYNALLVQALRERTNVFLHDVAYLASSEGLSTFFDERLWSTSKYACATHSLPQLCVSLARLIACSKGKLTKVIVLDLDNTIWGGVIGDDGIEGIALGGDAYGEAFQVFQRYLRSLKDRGYVLAICSKNIESVALDAFRNHPEMVLKETDIAVFVANWEDKPSNLQRIAVALNLGLDSFVFVDDSPFERGLVRSVLPMVHVPEMPEDVTDYVATLEDSGLFEATEYTEEDRGRSHSYHTEIQRVSEQARFASLDDYLKSLEMKIDCGPFNKEDLPRIAQLIQRSNQFNLRTQRLSQAQCEEYRHKGVTVAARISDRYGDYGLISAICCDLWQEHLFVAELVMSCRVLKRGVEEYLMNRLFSECRRLGLAGVRGEYLPTPKNGLVKDFYKSFGFSLMEEDLNRQVWYLDADHYTPRPTFIL
jgi:FkbH-like protein